MGGTLSSSSPDLEQEWNSQCIPNSTTFHFPSTPVWRINYYVAAEGQAQAQSQEHLASAFRATPAAGLWIPAVLFCWPETTALIFL